MLKKIISWFRGNGLSAQAVTKIKAKPIRIDPNTKVYLCDPTYPNLIINELNSSTTFLPMRSMGESGTGQPLGSLKQQAMALKLMVNDVLVFMAGKSPKKISKWAAVKTLSLMSRAGVDINAYYDRNSLRFFLFGDQILNKNIYACDSRPVVAHEFGHAFLDILRPDWWSVQSLEAWAFHESFGDMTAILNSLKHDALIDYAITETGGDLMKSNIITRLGAEMGIGLYHITGGEHGELPNCLRDISQAFNYIEPEKLPTDGLANELLSEPHSFSIVFTGAFWEILVKIGASNRDGMKAAREIITHYLLAAVVKTPTTVRLFDAIARQMLNVDRIEGGKYQHIMLDVFTTRGILRQQVRILEDVDFDTILNDIKEPYEIEDYGTNKVIRTLSTKTMKLSDTLGPVSALDNNPLIDLEIVVPNQSAYYFDNDKLVDVCVSHEDEIIDSAYVCLGMLNEGNLVGSNNQALFENRHGKLVRTKIS